MPKKRVRGFKSYEDATQHHLIQPRINRKLARLFYMQACVSEEVGEIAGRLKRVSRDEGGVLTSEARDALAKECGDALWTLTRLVNALGFSLEEVACLNAEKINDRVKRKRVKGSGDNR